MRWILSRCELVAEFRGGSPAGENATERHGCGCHEQTAASDRRWFSLGHGFLRCFSGDENLRPILLNRQLSDAGAVSSTDRSSPRCCDVDEIVAWVVLEGGS